MRSLGLLRSADPMRPQYVVSILLPRQLCGVRGRPLPSSRLIYDRYKSCVERHKLTIFLAIRLHFFNVLPSYGPMTFHVQSHLNERNWGRSNGVNSILSYELLVGPGRLYCHIVSGRILGPHRHVGESKGAL